MKFFSHCAFFCLMSLGYTTAVHVEYFTSPEQGSIYQPGQTVYFALDAMPDRDGHPVQANLYADGGYNFPIQNLGYWDAETVGDDSTFAFTSQLDPNLPPGRYFVRIDVENDNSDDLTRSHTFEVRDLPYTPQLRAIKAQPPVQDWMQTIRQRYQLSSK